MADRPWHTESAETALRELAAVPQGLTFAEAQRRLAQYGPNALPEGGGRPVLRMFADQFADFMILVLIAAAIVSGLVGELSDTVAIVVIVLLNAAIGFAQEFRAERAMAALRLMAAPTARARRDGAVAALPADRLVPGDIVLLEAGNVVPADLRLIEAAQLRLAEAALTGESQPVDKQTGALAEARLPLGDRANMAWKGTLVASGRGAGVVVATGLATELGRIARLLAAAEEVKTPLQKRLARFGARIAWAVLALCAVMFAAGLARGEPPVLMFLTAVSLAVAAIPEALPAVAAIALALGAAKMVRQNALIRRLPAVETLGSITFICSDKTGTLTQNRMRAEAFWTEGEDTRTEPWPSLLRALALANDAAPAADGGIVGDPTEVALLEAAIARGIDLAALESRSPRNGEFPFDAGRKRMTTVHRLGPGGGAAGAAAPLPQGGFLACVKGAPEAVLARCAVRLTARGPAPFDAAAALAQAERLAARGLRVLAFAERRLDGLPADSAEAESGLVFLGLVGLMDPPREEAAAAVAECRAAGIVPVMITGDHPATARAIAERLGILDQGGRVVSGAELAAMSEADFAGEVRDIRVYARVDPEQKIRIVRALQAAGEFAAMTGDGVNDAPALKAADIGVAMGLSGTETAREAADMVLTDDNFATLVAAVEEGRGVFDNLIKFVVWTLPTNFGEGLVLTTAIIAGAALPITPLQILWINMTTAVLLGLMLAFEPIEAGVMARPPRRPEAALLDRRLGLRVVLVGVLMLLGAFGLFEWKLDQGGSLGEARTLAVNVFVAAEMFYLFNCRSMTQPLWRLPPFGNPWVWVGVAGMALLQGGFTYLPWMQRLFHSAPLAWLDWLLVLAVGGGVALLVSLEKWLLGRVPPRSLHPR